MYKNKIKSKLAASMVAVLIMIIIGAGATLTIVRGLSDSSVGASDKALDLIAKGNNYNEIVSSGEVFGENLALNSKSVTLNPRNTGAAGDNYNYAKIHFKDNLKKGEKYTVSADVIIHQGSISKISILSRKVGNAGNFTIGAPSINDGQIETTFTANGHDVMMLMYAGLAGSTRNRSVTFNNIKVEQGIEKTPWSPALQENN